MHSSFVILIMFVFIFLLSPSMGAAPKCRSRPVKRKRHKGIIPAIVVPAALGVAIIGICSFYLYRFVRSRRSCRRQEESLLEYTSTGSQLVEKPAAPAGQDEEACTVEPCSSIFRRKNKILPSFWARTTSSSVPVEEHVREIHKKSEFKPTQETEHEFIAPKVYEPPSPQAGQGSRSELHIDDEIIAEGMAVSRALSPETVQEFRSSLDTYVRNAGLHKFFPPNHTYLSTVAKKAAILRTDSTTDLGSPDNIKRLLRLSLYRLIIYCDDSSSMSGSRFQIQCQLVSRIARVATKIVPDDVGVNLYFINQGCFTNIKVDNVEDLVSSRHLSPGTPIGTTLRSNILYPLVFSPLSTPNERMDSPLLICIITDGCPQPEPQDTLKRSVVECRRKLQQAGLPFAAVRFSVSQIGNSPAAERFLDELRRDTEIQDIVRCTTDRLDVKYAELRLNERELELWLLQVLTNPLM